MAPITAVAQDESPRTWSLESGESQVVEVGPHRSYVVLDPDRIRVETVAPDTLSVTALDDRGAAVMYVFTERGPRTLVFYVREPPASTGPTPLRATRPAVRPAADFVYSAYGVLSGDGPRVVRSTSHQLSLTQEHGDTGGTCPRWACALAGVTSASPSVTGRSPWHPQ
ncbi:MAG: hypothetical protein JRI25_28560 [Deltaproteobacteria bacterium]|nr:hypothetical protein [Deltaproteobacteria bacterium]